jgi:hypothetical protein
MKIIKWSSEKLGSHEILLDDEDFEKFGADGSKRRHICSKIYKTPEEAARKYNELAKQYHGEFAYQNPVTAIKYADGTMYFVSPYRKRT